MSSTHSSPPEVTLRQVSASNVCELVALRVAPAQTRFVAPNGDSIAEGAFTPGIWMRGIYSSGQPVGFLALVTDEANSFFNLWRFMITAEHQRKNLGTAAMAKVIKHVRSHAGARKLVTSYVPGVGDPSGFYKGLGFVETGEVFDGEHVLMLTL